MNNEVITVKAKDIHQVRKLETVVIEISTLLNYFKQRKSEIMAIPFKEIRHLSNEQIMYYDQIRDTINDTVLTLETMDRGAIAQYANIFDKLYRNQDIMEEQNNE
jgi:hypothetical protein